MRQGQDSARNSSLKIETTINLIEAYPLAWTAFVPSHSSMPNTQIPRRMIGANLPHGHSLSPQPVTEACREQHLPLAIAQPVPVDVDVLERIVAADLLQLPEGLLAIWFFCIGLAVSAGVMIYPIIRNSFRVEIVGTALTSLNCSGNVSRSSP